MAKILSQGDCDIILEESKSLRKNYQTSYFRLTEDIGKKVVQFKTALYSIEPGDEDLLGRVWGNSENQDWIKNEALANIRETEEKEVVWGFGGPKSVHLRAFITSLKEYKIPVESMEGTIWTAERTGPWSYDYKLIGRADEKKTKKGETNKITTDKLYESGVNVIKSLTDGNPTFLDNMKISRLITALSLQGPMSEQEAEIVIKDLEKNKIIKTEKDKVSIL